MPYLPYVHSPALLRVSEYAGSGHTFACRSDISSIPLYLYLYEYQDNCKQTSGVVTPRIAGAGV